MFNQFYSVLTQRSGISTVYQHKNNDDGHIAIFQKKWLEKFEISSTEKLLTYLASFISDFYLDKGKRIPREKIRLKSGPLCPSGPFTLENQQ